MLPNHPIVISEGTLAALVSVVAQMIDKASK
jgi:hypothetical protein